MEAHATQQSTVREPIDLEVFVAYVQRNRPARLPAAILADVRPKPWIDRAGHGSRARIRMRLGDVKYERSQGETVWRRVNAWS